MRNIFDTRSHTSVMLKNHFNRNNSLTNYNPLLNSIRRHLPNTFYTFTPTDRTFLRSNSRCSICCLTLDFLLYHHHLLLPSIAPAPEKSLDRSPQIALRLQSLINHHLTRLNNKLSILDVSRLLQPHRLRILKQRESLPIRIQYDHLTIERTETRPLIIQKRLHPHGIIVLFLIVHALLTQLGNEDVALAQLLFGSEHAFLPLLDFRGGVDEVFDGLVVIVLDGADRGFETRAEGAALFADHDGFAGEEGGCLGFLAPFVGVCDVGGGGAGVVEGGG
mmetsp:Transcript_2099/g.4076  ORF Transcript_2099/g.4076 Transcript_2099/m.4076 type:complete len:277 (-) Transcript_2099:332-1162(-)